MHKIFRSGITHLTIITFLYISLNGMQNDCAQYESLHRAIPATKYMPSEIWKIISSYLGIVGIMPNVLPIKILNSCKVLTQKTPATFIIFHPKKPILATATSFDITVWNHSTGQKVKTYRANKAVHAIAFNNQGTHIAWSEDIDLIVCNIENDDLSQRKTYKKLFSFLINNLSIDPIKSIAFDPTDTKVALGGFYEMGFLNLKNEIFTPRPLDNNYHAGYLRFAYDNTGTKLAMTSGMVIRIMDVNTMIYIRIYDWYSRSNPAFTQNLHYGAFSHKTCPGGSDKSLVDEKKINIYDVESNTVVHTINIDQKCRWLKFDKEAKVLVSAPYAGLPDSLPPTDEKSQQKDSVFVWNFSEKVKMLEIPDQGPQKAYALNPSGTLLAHTDNNKVVLWNIDKLSVPFTGEQLNALWHINDWMSKKRNGKLDLKKVARCYNLRLRDLKQAILSIKDEEVRNHVLTFRKEQEDVDSTVVNKRPTVNAHS